MFKQPMKIRLGSNWDITSLDALKGTSVDALFGKLPFDVVGGGPFFDQSAISQKITPMGDGQGKIDLLLHNEEGEPFLIHLLKR